MSDLRAVVLATRASANAIRRRSAAGRTLADFLGTDAPPLTPEGAQRLLRAIRARQRARQDWQRAYAIITANPPPGNPA